MYIYLAPLMLIYTLRRKEGGVGVARKVNSDYIQSSDGVKCVSNRSLATERWKMEDQLIYWSLRLEMGLGYTLLCCS